jgi:ABC-2 type transport system ATP-binding protein
VSMGLALRPSGLAQPSRVRAPAGERMSAGVVVEDATKVIDGVKVLDGVSFTAQRGRVTVLLGPNGAGKSTVLRVALGVDRLTSGRATIGGRPFREHERPLEVVGAFLTPDAAHPRRSARGHLAVVAASNGLPRDSVTRALELVGIAEIANLPVRQMSLGMRQRLGLAAALIGDPAVVILDEPHNGLDAAAIRWLRVVLRALAEGERTVLVSSNLISEIEPVCDDVVVIDGGRVRAASTLADFCGGAPGDPGRVPLEERYLSIVGGAS